MYLCTLHGSQRCATILMSDRLPNKNPLIFEDTALNLKPFITLLGLRHNNQAF